MKAILSVILVSLGVVVFAQKSDTIQISHLSKVMLVTDEPIQGNPVMGSKIGRCIKQGETTLILEADGLAIKNILSAGRKVPPTNLLVRTTSAYYNFIIVYEKNPNRHVIPPTDYVPIYRDVEKAPVSKDMTDLLEDQGNKVSYDTTPVKMTGGPVEYGGFGKVPVDRLIELDMNNEDLIFGGYYSGSRLFFTVSNLWVDGRYLYVRVKLENRASSPYDVDYFRFVSSDGKWGTNKKNTPRTVEIEVFDRLKEVRTKIEPDEIYTNVFVFEKFTLHKGMYFNVQVGEVNGGRKATINMTRADMYRSKNIH